MGGTDEPRTCGKGLSERSDVPARLSALTAAMAAVLDTHLPTLDLSDDKARPEQIAYQQLAIDLRHVTAQLREIADRMLGYRDLPMARHHSEKMLAPEIREAVGNLLQCERDLMAHLKTVVEEDQAILGVLTESR